MYEYIRETNQKSKVCTLILSINEEVNKISGNKLYLPRKNNCSIFDKSTVKIYLLSYNKIIVESKNIIKMQQITYIETYFILSYKFNIKKRGNETN